MNASAIWQKEADQSLAGLPYHSYNCSGAGDILFRDFFHNVMHLERPKFLVESSEPLYFSNFSANFYYFYYYCAKILRTLVITFAPVNLKTEKFMSMNDKTSIHQGHGDHQAPFFTDDEFMNHLNDMIQESKPEVS